LTEVEEKTAKLLADLWVKNRPLIEERMALLDRASAAASAGSLDDALRVGAVGAAHNLAGSLGMYGYDEGTRVARELEVMLVGAAVDAERMRVLVAELRASIS
jgi:hypothetical protein